MRLRLDLPQYEGVPQNGYVRHFGACDLLKLKAGLVGLNSHYTSRQQILVLKRVGRSYDFEDTPRHDACIGSPAIEEKVF
ncbi:MAG TPA: hypothetical protein VFR18_19010 [Terriglobia bacterium]|nr:hypothetical protein [Terriglobia bacterium]